jgi:hypothetical protein
MRFHEIRLIEAVTNKPMTFYHGTKSEPFDQFNPTLAVKGEKHWNPLGDGMYATNNSRFAGQFGGNVYPVVIPPGTTYRRISKGEWPQMARGMVEKALRVALKAVGDNFATWTNGSDLKKDRAMSHFRSESYQTLERHDPYTGLYEVSAIVGMDFGRAIGEAFGDAIVAESQRRFGKYGFVIFPGTNDAFQFDDEPVSIEVVIYNPALQKTA